MTVPQYSNTSGLSVFQKLDEISFIKFPSRLDWLLLTVCVKGEISATIDVSPRKLTPSCIMVLRPGHIINHCKASDDFEGFFIVVKEEKLNELLPSMHFVIPYSLLYNSNPIIEIDRDELSTLQLTYSLLKKQLSYKERPFNDQALSSMCEVLFYNTLSMYASRSQNKCPHTRRDELLSNFIDLIETHFKKERSVIFYADKLFVTPKHLSAVLKEISGRTAGEWIDHRVILEAKMLLRTTGMNIQEISLALNFSNQSFFGKYFKHLTGMSPRDYRSKISDN